MTEINYLNLPAVYGAAADLQSMKISQRLDMMKMAEFEKEAARKERRNSLAKDFFSPGQAAQNIQPQMTPGQAPGMTGNALMPQQGYQAQEFGVPAQAPKQDFQGYGNALMQAGDAEGGMAAMKSATEQRTAEFDLKKKGIDLANTLSQMDERTRTQSMKNLELVGNAASGVLSEYDRLIAAGVPDAQARQQVQPFYQQAIQMLTQNGVNVQNPSPAFDPDQARAAVSFTVGVKDRLTLAETKRHNVAMEKKEGGDKAPTPTTVKGEALRIFVDKGYNALNPQQKLIVDQELADPLMGQAVKLVTDDIKSVRMSADEKVQKIYTLYEDMKKQSRGMPEKTAGAKSGEMDKKPPAAQHNGKILRDTVTGKRYKSDGKNWMEIK